MMLNDSEINDIHEFSILKDLTRNEKFYYIDIFIISL
jgi:hypothetical protein